MTNEKKILVIFKTDSHHSKNNREFIGLAKDIESAVKIIKNRADDEDNGISEECLRFFIDNLQTQGYQDGEFLAVKRNYRIMNKQEVIERSKVFGNTIKIPPNQLDRKVFLELKKAFIGIGGKWKGGKTWGFVFDSDPTELLNRLKEGESINLKKDFQFFETPNNLAKHLVSLANIEGWEDVLEPSAGKGAIIREILNTDKIHSVDYCELMDLNSTYLEKEFKNCVRIGVDFLEYDPMHPFEKYYNVIIANPPFSKNQDIDHVMHMYKCLAYGGRLVSIMSKHWEFASDKKSIEFRKWLYAKIDDGSANVIGLPEGTFKDSGTMVGGFIVVIDSE